MYIMTQDALMFISNLNFYELIFINIVNTGISWMTDEIAQLLAVMLLYNHLQRRRRLNGTARKNQSGWFSLLHLIYGAIQIHV